MHDAGSRTARPASAAHNLHSARRDVKIADGNGSKTARANLESAPNSMSQALTRQTSASRRASLPAPQRTLARPATTGRVSAISALATVPDCDTLSNTSSRRSVGRDSGWPLRSRSRSRGRDPSSEAPASARKRGSDSRPSNAREPTSARRSSLQPPHGLTLQLPSELGRTLSGAMSEHTNGGPHSNRSTSGALQDSTNSVSRTDTLNPPRPRSRASNSNNRIATNTANSEVRTLAGPSPSLAPSGIENHSSTASHRGNEGIFLGMGKADEELSLSSKREMSVLEQV